VKALLVACGVILVALVLFVIGYRGGWFLSDNDRLGDAIRIALPTGDETRETTLDLDAVIDGDWDRAIIHCGDAYGLPLISFMRGDEIVREYNQAGDIMAEPKYFDPCMQNGRPLIHSIELVRDAAQLDMVFERGRYDSAWVLAPTG